MYTWHSWVFFYFNLNKESREDTTGTGEITICSQFEEMLSHLNGSSTGEWHLEIGLGLPAACKWSHMNSLKKNQEHYAEHRLWL